MTNPLANDKTWAAQCIRERHDLPLGFELVEIAGRDDERFLIDYMADGSTVALLMFDIQMLALMKRRNAHCGTILRCEQAIQDRAKQARTRIFQRALFALRMNRKGGR